MQKHPEAQGGSPGWRHRKSQQPAFRQKKPRQFLRWVLAKSRNSRQNRQPVAVRFPAPLLFNYSPLIPRAGRVTSFGGFLRRRRVNINIFVADFRQFNSFRTFPASIIPWRHPLPPPTGTAGTVHLRCSPGSSTNFSFPNWFHGDYSPLELFIGSVQAGPFDWNWFPFFSFFNLVIYIQKSCRLAVSIPLGLLKHVIHRERVSVVLFKIV